MTENGCGKKNPLIRDGKSQDQRTLDALSTTYVGIDERSTAELLRFAKDFAGQVRYFDTTNAPNGDWEEFITDDISTRIALISLTDSSSGKESFDDYVAITADLILPAQDKTDALSEVFLLLAKGFQEIKMWVRSTEDSEKYNAILMNLVKSRLRRQLGKLIGFHKAAIGLYGWSHSIPQIYSNFGKEWIDTNISSETSWSTYLADIAANTSAFGSSGDLKKQLDAITYRLRILYNNYHESRVKIISEASNFLNETLEDWPDHNPHMALFLSFLLLYKNAQESINELVDSHLNFYYSDVLRLEPNEPVADSVYLILELAKNTARHLLEKGVLFRAGKDDLGKELLYALDDDSTFNKAVTTDFKTIFRNSADFDRLYAAPVANSGDGIGGDFDNEDEPSWPAFGDIEVPEAEIGFVFTSPVLLLAEGERKITLTVRFDPITFAEGDQARINFIAVNNLQGVSISQAEPDFKVYLSGVDDWLEPELVTVSLSSVSHSLNFEITLPEDYPAVGKYIEKVHKAGLNTVYPVFKAILNMTEVINSYGMYRHMIVQDITVSATVTGVKNVIVANDYSVLNSSKTFHPFGSVPAHGSRFMVGSHEVFSKKLDSLKLNIEWAKFPSDFDDWYKEYDTVSPAIEVGNIKAKIEILDGRKWKSLKHNTGGGGYEDVEVIVFKENEFPNGAPPNTQSDDGGAVFYDFGQVVLESSVGTPVPLSRDEEMASFLDYNTSIPRGFLRVTLGDRDLGHGDFNKLYTDRVIALSKYVEGIGTKPILPNEPYTPEVKGISFDYSTSEKVVFRSSVMGTLSKIKKFANRIEQLFHLQPFGLEEVHPETYKPFSGSNNLDENDIYLLPQYEGEGTLFIGIENWDLNSSNSLSLLFKMAEGTANPDLSPPTIIWSYLTGNRWTRLNDFQVPSDTTNGLIETGMVSFIFPETADTEHTILSTGKHWLRAHVEQDSAGIADIIAVHAQASLATFQNNDNDPLHLAQPLVAETISKLKIKQPEVKGIDQPFASFGGKMKEDSAEYFRRVSERLRHKDRAVTIWDYETMILQQFPSVYKVKCINHTHKYSELAPGYVYVVVIPSQVNLNSVDQLQPRASVSTLEAIYAYLLGKISPFVKLKVANPTYERIQVQFNVKLMNGRDEGLYKAKLIEDIVAWLSPWAYKDGIEISFEGRIHRSVILNFVEELSYVDYVTDFKLFHYPDPDSESSEEVLEAIATTPMSILVSHVEHLPTLISDTVTQTVTEDEC